MKNNNPILRKCIVNNKLYNRDELIRITSLNNKFVIDPLNKLGGRGLYVKCDSQTINLLIQKKLLQKYLKTNDVFDITRELLTYVSTKEE